MEKTFRYRIYPNKQQKILIQKTFGCVRYVYNYYLTMRKNAYEKEGRSMWFSDCCKDLTSLKQQLPWLREPDKQALQNCLRDLQNTYNLCINKTGVNYPKYRTKKNRQAYRTNNGNYDRRLPIIIYSNGRIRVPKLGWLKTRDSRVPEGKILNATIVQERSGKYYCCLCCTDIEEKSLPKTDKQIGLDLGLKEFCTTSDGDKFYNPRFLQRSSDKLARLQRELSRKSSGGKNHEKARLKVARQYEKISNQKKDYLHKLSTQLIRENDVICLETLGIASMIHDAQGTNKVKADMRNRISEVSWSAFIRMLEYKAKWYGREIRKAEKYYSSSQICHICGH